ncbi:MAG: TetR/AcrR family transcriptional regulator [Spirochaetales bacterium]|nr:TetR/AcrR family transcriptional regulator [Spirochaetales bacterium]
MKEKITKNRIISAAFTEWSKSCFWECSLQSVSENLGISKTALYRYFKNKEELLSSMEDVFVIALKEIAQSIKTRILTLSFQESVQVFIETSYQFFTKNPYYLNYLVFRHIQKRETDKGSCFEKHQDFQGIESLLSSSLSSVFLGSFPLPENEHDKIDFSLLYRGVIFFLPLFIENTHAPGLKVNFVNSDQKKNVGSLIYDINMNGFCNPESFGVPDYEMIENFFYFKEDIFSREKIVDAIYDVVLNEGLHKASISKIAAHLGIQKSSIYHYFKSKSDLIASLIKQSAEKLNLYFKESICSFKSPADRLYCLLIVTASYFYYTRPAIYLYSWLIFNKLIDKEYLKPPSHLASERFKVFNELFHSKQLKTYDLDVKIIFSYLNFNVLTSILMLHNKQRVAPDEKQEESEKMRIILNMRQIHNYFLYGILGGHHES